MSGEGALEAIDRIIASGREADDLLREVVHELGTRYDHVAIRFVEGDVLVDGPSAGEPGTEPALVVPISFEKMKVAELEVAPEQNRELVERAAERLAPYCLVGWDTHGERWTP